MDVKIVFLKGDLAEDVYTTQLESFESINLQKDVRYIGPFIDFSKPLEARTSILMR